MARATPPVDEVLKYVRNARFPSTKAQLIEEAKRHNAPPDVLHVLEIVKEETKYDDLADVREGLLREPRYRHH